MQLENKNEYKIVFLVVNILINVFEIFSAYFGAELLNFTLANNFPKIFSMFSFFLEFKGIAHKISKNVILSQTF